MNIQNIGIDLVEIKKIAKIGKLVLAKRILSNQEYQIYNTFKHPKRQLTFLAGRWAAKEALFKAFQTASNSNYSKLNYRNLSILNDQNGSPYFNNTILEKKFFLSITHTSNYALALVIISN